jgi:hypothetical protein
MKLTAIIPPCPEVLGPTECSDREFFNVDEFCTALGLAAGITVSIIEGSLSDVPADGFVLLYYEYSMALDFAHRIGARVVLINAQRGSLFRQLEPRRLAGAIEERRYFNWRKERGEESGSGLVGRKDVARRIGATIVHPHYSTEHYAELSHPRCRDLPELLALYLAGLEVSLGA